MALKIILVRHGETDWNRVKRVQGGSSNTPLNDIGRQQAKGLSAILAKEKIRAVYSSPLERAAITAECIANMHNLEVQIEPSLREIEAGKLEGMLSSELGKRFSEFLIQDGKVTNIAGGESLNDVQERCWDFVGGLISQYDDCTLILVSHYFVILSIICTILDMPVSQVNRFRMDTGSISIITLGGDSSWLQLFNDTSYMSDELCKACSSYPRSL
ncbi:MAG: histidine phosphatase family protein [Dehalococcoidales bacterium]|nr:histidine phosphatase family protein [Dehalococcoidales bacterium]